MSNTRHTVVMRRDLGMAAGLLAAQANHAADAFMRERILKGEEFTDEEKDWMKTPYISILAVNNFEELKKVFLEAQSAKLPSLMWHDTVPSTVQPSCFLEGVMVGISIGPADFDKIKAVTGYLPRFEESMPTKTVAQGDM